MRPIARHSTRLATINTSKQCATPSKRQCEQHRTFNTTVRRRQEPRPPNGSSESQTPLNELRKHERKSENGDVRQDQHIEQSNVERRTASDAWTHSRKRKAAHDVPKPPPIPEWFLKQNVRLYKDHPGQPVTTDRGEVVRCVDVETGRTLLTIPYENAVWDGMDLRPKKESGDKSNKQAENSTTTANASRRSEKPTRTALSVLVDLQTQQVRDTDQGRWSYIEAEASLRAALSLANKTDSSSSSFARDRVDLSLQFQGPDPGYEMNAYVEDLARIVEADVIRLDVNDLAELSQDYIGNGLDEPGTISTLGYDVYEGYEPPDLGASRPQSKTRDEEEEEAEDEDAEEDRTPRFQGSNVMLLGGAIDLRKLMQLGQSALGNSDMTRAGQQRSSVFSRPRSTAPTTDLSRWEEKLSALLEQLIDAAKHKQMIGGGTAAGPTESNIGRETESQSTQESGIQAREQSESGQGPTMDGSSNLEANTKRTDTNAVSKPPEELRPEESQLDLFVSSTPPATFMRAVQQRNRRRRSNPLFWFPTVANHLSIYLTAAAWPSVERSEVDLLREARSWPPKSSPARPSRTIVHVRDLADICETQLGNQIVHRLVDIVRKRRRNGQEIVVVGTTAQDAPVPVKIAGDHADTFPFLTLNIPPFFNFTRDDHNNFRAVPAFPGSNPTSARILEINLRHIQSMIRRISPRATSASIWNIAGGQQTPALHTLPGMINLRRKVLSMDQIQRVALVAVGLSQSHMLADEVHPFHVATANFLTSRADDVASQWAEYMEIKHAKSSLPIETGTIVKAIKREETSQAKIDRLKKICNPHETRLLGGVVDSQNIKIAFADVHAPIETIDALKSLTSLSLLRPDAFAYGVLANDRLPGLLLYGPPGTGKTLLAKAVAKESNATVLEVTGAQIYEKYVGEGEKMVQAVFSLAKKLSPCVVFIDEADAIFGNRGHNANRSSHRQIINQFLREWDGMDDHSVFMMVATNRPFDLDDAVLRRLPRRLLVDLPVAKDRESILGIHLKHEQLDSSVSLDQLAKETALYSGSDLKNLAVAAALACVREENELADANRDDKDFKLPEKRTLTSKHFEKALTEISASISEDMSSLNAIRKFDEDYGDRKGRRKKNAWGFGEVEGANEKFARVR